jgi:hypothetical protein
MSYVSGFVPGNLALLKLAAITGREDFGKTAEAGLRFHGGRLAEAPLDMLPMLPHLLFPIRSKE